MIKDNIINGSIININSTLKKNFNNLFGFKLYMLSKFEQRIEIFSSYQLLFFRPIQFLIMLNFFSSIVPNKKNFKNRKLLNIFFLDIINSYRGWRHSKGLPVRGQRTWTNAWTSYRSNLILREYKILLAKKIYGNVPVNELNVAYLAEQVNLLWKLQWEQEWREAKKKRLTSIKKNTNVYKIDLYSMSKGFVSGFTKKGDKAKKIKQVSKKNYFSLGFDPGFTKILLKTSFLKSKKNLSRERTSIIMDSAESKVKRK